MRGIIAAAAFVFGLASAEWDNNIPVPGRRPAYIMGDPKVGIDFEVVYDLVCDESADAHEVVMEFLNSNFNVTNTLVKDAVQFSFSFLPLSYHHEAWVPTLMIPYFFDQCQFSEKCQLLDYVKYCFDNVEGIHNMEDISENQIVQGWVKNVSMALNINQTELASIYNPKSDTHQSEVRTRQMFKWNTSHRISGVPFGFVNGILIESFPQTVNDWMDILFTVYNSQYRPPKAANPTSEL